MDDKKSFEFDPEEARQRILAGKLSMQDLAGLLRSDVSRIEQDIETLKIMLLALKKKEPENTKDQAQLKALLDGYTAWLAKYDGLVVEYEDADDV